MSLTKERIVVSVGGSLIVPDAIDTDFLTRFRTLILEKVQKGFTFSIIAGGGKTARRYQDAVRAVSGDISHDDLDWLGIHATRLNGHLLHALFHKESPDILIEDPTQPVDTAQSILIAGGWKPGCSTDYDAVLMAKTLGAKRLVNLTTTIDYVYDKDPHVDQGGKKIEKASWAEFGALIPKEWSPGLSSLFDPIAAKEAEAVGIELAIISGALLEEFSNYIDGKPFVGTVIS